MGVIIVNKIVFFIVLLALLDKLYSGAIQIIDCIVLYYQRRSCATSSPVSTETGYRSLAYLICIQVRNQAN